MDSRYLVFRYGVAGLCLSLIAGCASRRQSQTYSSYPPPPYIGYGAPAPYQYPGPPQPAPPPPPRYVTVVLQDAAIAPTKPDGRPWDCCGNVSEKTADQISSALTSIPNPYTQYAAVITLLAPLAGAGTIPPEVFGWAQLYTNGEAGERVELNRPWQQDAYTPLLTAKASPPTWHHVPLDAGTRIMGRLWDKDLAEDDAIGPFDINYSHLWAALQGGGLYPVRVDKTILFIRISVMAER